MLRRVILLLVVFSLFGCAGLGYREDQLKVTIADIKMLDSTLMEQRFLVKLRVQNRGQEALSVRGMSFDVELNGKDFGSGVSNQEVSVPAFEDAVIDVKLTSTIFGVIRQLQSMRKLESKPFMYRLSGRLNTLGSMISLPFSEEGEIDLRLPDSRSLQPL